MLDESAAAGAAAAMMQQQDEQTAVVPPNHSSSPTTAAAAAAAAGAAGVGGNAAPLPCELNGDTDNTNNKNGTKSVDITSGSMLPAGTAATKKYYYWHSHEKERAKLGDVAPITRPQQVDNSLHDAGNFDLAASLKRTPITKYSWCNNNLSVSVYVDFVGVGAIQKAQEEEDKKNSSSSSESGKKLITHAFRERSLELTIDHGGKLHMLRLALSKRINPTTSTLRYKPDSVVFKLMKARDKKTVTTMKTNAETGEEESVEEEVEEAPDTWYELIDTKNEYADNDD